MQVLAREGRTAEALKAFQRARQTLRDELGIDPGEALRRLEHDVLTGDPEPRRQPRAPAASRRATADHSAGAARPPTTRTTTRRTAVRARTRLLNWSPDTAASSSRPLGG